METFKASNGHTLQIGNYGDVRIESADSFVGNALKEFDFLDGADMDALGEYSLQKFFTSLDWEQDSEEPHILVRRNEELDDSDGRAIRVVDLKTTNIFDLWENHLPSDPRNAGIRDRYFAAHPAPNFKPWLHAQLGEIWNLTLNKLPRLNGVYYLGKHDPEENIEVWYPTNVKTTGYLLKNAGGISDAKLIYSPYPANTAQGDN